MVWTGTALFNDYYDIDIDRVVNPDRPIPSRAISRQALFVIAILLYAAALILTLIEGTVELKALIIMCMVLGYTYSAPPVRLRLFGLMANSVIGFGCFSSFLGGGLAQYVLAPNHVIMAASLGILAAVSSMVKDFKDCEGDRQVGVKTLPVVLGYKKAAILLKLGLIPAYIIAVVPLMYGTYKPISLLLMVLVFIFNFIIVTKLECNTTLNYRRKAYIVAIMCYIIVVVLYLL